MFLKRYPKVKELNITRSIGGARGQQDNRKRRRRGQQDNSDNEEGRMEGDGDWRLL